MTAAPAAHVSAVDRRFLAALYGLVLLSVAVMCYLYEDPTALVLAAAAAVVSWLLVDSPRGRALPKLAINSFLVLIALNFWREVWDGESFNLMNSLGHFIVGLLICKFFEQKRPRDVAQIFVLSLLLVVASAMYSSTLSFALLLIVYFAALVYTAVLLNLRLHTQAVTSGWRVPAVFPANGRDPRLTRDIRLTTIRAVLVLLPLATVVFLAIPRTRGNAFFSRLNAGATFQTGFSEEVRFQDYGRLNQSDAVALDVSFYQKGVNVGAEIVEPYFRGLTLEIYDSRYGRWSHDRHADEDVSVKLDNDGYALLAPPTAYLEAEPLVQEYRISTPKRDFLFHVSPVLSVTVPKQQEVYFSRNAMVIQAGQRPGPATYRVESLGRAGEPLHTPDVPHRPPETDAPSGEIQAMARRLAGDQLPPAGVALTPEQMQAIASRFETYLRLNYPYSLEFTRGDNDLEPITDFLLNHKETGGHCEYFAASMVMLCRSVNIEARMVTGYHGGEFNSLSNSFTVLQRHAHAWAEYYVPGIGWVHSDPSPISATSSYSGSMLARWAMELRQIVQNVWLTSVVTFDNESRQRVAAWIGELLGAYKRMDIWQADIWTKVLFGISSLGIPAVLFYAWRSIERDRRARALLGPARRHARLSGDGVFLEELLRLIARRLATDGAPEAAARRHARRLDQTPREFIDTAAPVLGPAAEDARWLVGTFYSLRFGGIAVTPEVRKQIAQAMRRVREAVRIPVEAVPVSAAGRP
jgi:transglutaminase-like putative cysteine protease